MEWITFFYLFNCIVPFQIGVLIEDKEFVDSWMGGKPWRAGKFASSLRLTLWSEHLGLRVGEVEFIFIAILSDHL